MLVISGGRVLEGHHYYRDDLPIHVNRTREDFYLEQHAHDFVEIIYVENGTGFHYIEDTQLRVRQGDLFYLPVGTRHVFRPTGKAPASPLVVCNCVVDPAFLKALGAANGLQLPFDPVPEGGGGGGQWFAFHDHNEELGSIFRNLFNEYSMRKPPRKAALIAWILLLHAGLFQADGGSPSQPAGEGPVMAALKWLDRNLGEAVTLRDAASVAGMSPRHFYRLFRNQTESTFVDYVQNRRIARSRFLLETTPMSVAEVALSVGYKDLKCFHRVFKKISGITPAAYRRSRR